MYFLYRMFVAVAALPIFAGFASAELKISDWPLFRGDAHSTGVAQSKLPEDLNVVWRFEVEGGAFESTAAIVDGVVYIGDLDGKLFALDLATGEKRWEFDNGLAGFYASPAVRDGQLYIGDMDGRFHCLDLKTGQPKWAFQAEAQIDSSANFYKENVLFGSQDTTLYCLNAATGNLVWKHMIEDQIRCSPTIVDNRTFVAGCDGALHIIDLDEGVEVAGVPIEAPTMATPAVLGGNAYFGTEGAQFFCVNWKADKPKIEWTFEDQHSNLPLRSSAAVTAECVVVGSRAKRVYALNPQTGGELWRFAAQQRIDSSPVIVGNRVFVGAADGRLYALNLKDGQQLWEYEANGGFIGSPAVADGRLVVASDRGVVYCFGEKGK